MMKNKINRHVLQNTKPLQQNNIEDKLQFAQINVNQQIQTFNKQVNVEKDVFSEHKKDNRSQKLTSKPKTKTLQKQTKIVIIDLAIRMTTALLSC